MLNFTGYDVNESRRLFSGEMQSIVTSAGPSSMHRSPGYLQAFTDSCYDSPVNHACPPTGYGQSLTGYSAPTYGSYRLPFPMPRAYKEQRKFDCYSKPDLNCSTSISAHGNSPTIRPLELSLSSVCRLSVTFVHPTQPVEIFRNVSMTFYTVATRWPPCKIVRRSSQENPSVWG